jgi:hypothetical protein
MSQLEGSMDLSFALPVPAALVAAFLVGCGASSGGGFAEANSSPNTDSVSDGGIADATVAAPSDAASFMFISSSDGASTTTVSSVCTAGVYKGQFMTLVGAGEDGGATGGLMWNGSLSIDLKARTVVVSTGSASGENFVSETTELEIAEGGALEGGDMFGGAFFANLNGDLDCAPDAGPPYHLTATLSNGRYASLFENLPLAGYLTADYQASAPPTLMNGYLLVNSPDSGFTSNISASGSWTATWVSP